MRADPWPWLIVGGGAIAVAHWWPHRAHADAPELEELRALLADEVVPGDDPPPSASAPGAPRPRPFDLGRPTPADVRSIASSGWSRPRGNRQHHALDIPVPLGTPIHAVDDGMVLRVRTTNQSDAGLWVGVRHPSSLASRYLHLSRTLVETGQAVQRGDVVGLSGNTGHSTGPHLHLDLWAPVALLPAIERAVGKPRGGWGMERKSYGFAIPAEPWIPLDGYRASVEREALAAGIPLHSSGLRNAGFTYRPVGERGESYPEWLRALRGNSGVYVIRDRRSSAVVYVGESHSHRLYETLTRHFQEWRRWKGFWRDQYGEGHDPGLTYRRSSVEVAVRVTSANDAIDEEARLIRRLRPRDNLLGQPEPVSAVPF